MLLRFVMVLLTVMGAKMNHAGCVNRKRAKQKPVLWRVTLTVLSLVIYAVSYFSGLKSEY